MAPLPPQFRRILLVLAREPKHPSGDARHGYTLVAPLDEDGRIDIELWRANGDACEVRRFRENEKTKNGRLVRRGRAGWYFDYAPGEADDEAGYRLGNEQFVLGEYVSIREQDGMMHTFRVVAVDPMPESHT